MARDLETILDRLQRAKAFDEFQTLITDLRDHFDVAHVVYHAVSGTGEQYAALTYSPDWVERYIEQDYSRIDPVVLGCFRRFHPVDWKRLDWTGRTERAFLHEAIDAGVGNQGLSVPIRGPNGQFALMTVNDRTDDAGWSKFRDRHLQEVILLAHYLNQKALELERGDDVAQFAGLSPRETDALTLLGLGLSRAHAAEKLSISEHTLRVYVESARFKLGAANTLHAVAIAMARGLIIL